MRRNTLLISFFSIIIIGLILWYNKQDMKRQAELSERKVEAIPVTVKKIVPDVLDHQLPGGFDIVLLEKPRDALEKSYPYDKDRDQVHQIVIFVDDDVIDQGLNQFGRSNVRGSDSQRAPQRDPDSPQVRTCV